MIVYHIRNGSFDGVWSEVGPTLTAFQTLQAMEVVHSMTGIVPTNPVQTLVQVYSRIVMLWGVLIPFNQSKDSYGFFIAFIAWSFAEITRYLFYALNTFGMAPELVTWLRYSLFILFYPLGVIGELWIVYSIHPHLTSEIMFNKALAWSMYLQTPAYVYFPTLYRHLLKQRNKVLNPKTTSSSFNNNEHKG